MFCVHYLLWTVNGRNAFWSCSDGCRLCVSRSCVFRLELLNKEIAWVLLLVSKSERAGLLVWGKINKKKWDSGLSFSSPRTTFLRTEESLTRKRTPKKGLLSDSVV